MVELPHASPDEAEQWVRVNTRDRLLRPVPLEDRNRLIRISPDGKVLELRQGRHSGLWFWARMKEIT